MKRLFIAFALISVPLLAAASPFLSAPKASFDSPLSARMPSVADKPICNCAFDPETRTWTCIPKGCWVDQGPGIGASLPSPTLERDPARPLPGRIQPAPRF